MLEFLQSLPSWALNAMAMAVGIILAVGIGLLFGRWLRKMSAKLPPRE